MMVESEPFDLDQAMNDSNSLVVMQEELKAIEKKKTLALVKKAMKKPIGVKWIYKLKLWLNCEAAKHKAKLVARGFL